jgi:uncharacterized protein DUF262
VGEVANMYGNAELKILPEFQRLFRWTPERKSAFVESILIGIPIPSAFVFEEDGTWELIDGLQRISTVLEFMGVLKDPDAGKLRRSSLLADATDFKEVFRVTPDQALQQGNLEYAVRLAVHSLKDFPRGRDVQEFLDGAIIEILEEESSQQVMERLEWAVALLHRLGGEQALRPPEERHSSVARQIYQGGLWICGRSALRTGCASPASRASSESGEMLTFDHIPTGTTADSDEVARCHLT